MHSDNVLGEYTNPNETVNISLTQVGGNPEDLIGASVTITNDDTSETILTATWNGSTITTDIPMGTYYTISVSSITGYLDCADKSYLAGFQTERSIDFLYIAPGAYIEATDGSLYISSNWSSSGKTANSVVLITSNINHCYRIAIQSINGIIASHSDAWYETFPILSESAALATFNGKECIDTIYDYNISHSQTDATTYAAVFAKNYVFPNGESGAYIPSLGELYLISQNKTSIDLALTTLNATVLSNSSWSVTRHPDGGYYIWWVTNGNLDRETGGYNSIFHPIAEYKI